MIIRYNKEGYVDLESPIHMTEKQLNKLISFLNKISKVEEIEVEEKSKEMGSRESKMKKWTLDEYCMLLTPATNDDLANKMERSEMSVKMQRGHFVPAFMTWAKKKGHSMKVSKKIVKEFLRERGYL